jgi:hypothetical protein
MLLSFERRVACGVDRSRHMPRRTLNCTRAVQPGRTGAGTGTALVTGASLSCPKVVGAVFQIYRRSFTLLPVRRPNLFSLLDKALKLAQVQTEFTIPEYVL